MQRQHSLQASSFWLTEDLMMRLSFSRSPKAPAAKQPYSITDPPPAFRTCITFLSLNKAWESFDPAASHFNLQNSSLQMLSDLFEWRRRLLADFRT